MCRHIHLLVLIAALAAAPPGTAAEFKSPEGFTLQYPDGWIVASKQQQDQVRDAAKQLVGKANLPGNPNVAVMIHDPKEDEFLENINVVVMPGSPSIDDKAVEEYTTALRQQFASTRLNPSNVRVERTRVGDRDALSAHYDVTMPGAPQAMRQWQVLVPGGGRTYIITCSALPAQFNQYEFQFASIVSSFRIDRGLAGAWDGLPGPVRMGIIGGVIGGLIGAVVAAVKKAAGGTRRPASQASDTGQPPS